ncbi:phage tail assembly chaperone G [Abyssicoccus albus]|uniref:phage tail assembly chaperone G n=1 Tax=Abyssicoccus albus TaxID=1817405 RepID=UPI00097E1F38|nr:hypothetical protein [Abyssicoccus albus]AQL56415.1 hypothetical protein BVH56_05515 [Abyssicoccus albus]
MTRQITLFINDEEKTFSQPLRIKGSAVRKGVALMKKFESTGEEIPDESILLDMYQYIAEYGYNNQFTAEEYEDGLDSRDIMRVTLEEMDAVMVRDEDMGKLKEKMS